MLIFALMIGGIWLGRTPREVKREEFPVVEHKSFVIVLYGHNMADWCERALTSVFEQDYDHYRVIFIDDASTDGTVEKVKQFVLANHQEEKVVLIRSETGMGRVASLYRAVDTCLDREIVVPLDAKDWLATQGVLEKLNGVYQNPDVWLVESPLIDYPSYEWEAERQVSFYAALFKQIRVEDLVKKVHPMAYLAPLKKMGEGRVAQMEAPAAFLNRARCVGEEPMPKEAAKYKPLVEFPKPTRVDPLGLKKPY